MGWTWNDTLAASSGIRPAYFRREFGRSKMPRVRIHPLTQAGYVTCQVLDPPGGSVPQELRAVLEAHAAELLLVMDKPGTTLAAVWQDGDSEVMIYIIPARADSSSELDPLRLPFPDTTDE